MQPAVTVVLPVRLSLSLVAMVAAEDLVAKHQIFAVMVLVLVRVQTAVVLIVRVLVVRQDSPVAVMMVVVQTVDVAMGNVVREILHFVVVKE